MNDTLLSSPIVIVGVVVAAAFLILAGLLYTIDRLLEQRRDGAAPQAILSAQQVAPPAPAAPVDILVLDGGGTRGLISAAVLHELSVHLKKQPSEVFDLIVGTSAGGVIATFVGLFGINTKHMVTRDYRKKATAIFKTPLKPSSILKKLPGGKVLELFQQVFTGDPKYSHDDLKTALNSFAADRLAAGNPMGTRFSAYDKHGRVAVVTTAFAESDLLSPVVIRNYTPEKFPLHYHPNQTSNKDLLHDFTVADALHATSAGPTFFAPFIPPNSSYGFVDGGIVANSPIGLAVTEAKAIWPSRPIRSLTVLGTGVAPAELYHPSSNPAKWAQYLPNIVTANSSLEFSKAVALLEAVSNPPPTVLHLQHRLTTPIQLDETRADILDKEAESAVTTFKEKLHADTVCMSLMKILREKAVVRV